MIETCERCDGAGCRSCSSRGWVERVTEPSSTDEVLTCSTCDENHPAGHRVRSSIIEQDELPHAGTNKDAGREHGDDEHQEPDERIGITVEYPGEPVKLLRVRYGTLSKALAEAFEGRPW